MTTITVDPSTGEVTDVPAVIPAEQIKNLPADQREHAITAYLSSARDRLAEALEATGPQAVAQVKAEVATVAEMTKQLGLSKECRDDATEMVRRAEYALGKAIRKGQEDGAVRSRANSGGGPRGDYERGGRVVRVAHRDGESSAISPKEIEPDSYALMDAYAMAEADPEQFEQAITEAKSEGGAFALSRANVVRKVKQQASPRTRDQLAEEIQALASQGYASAQIARRLGHGEEWIRRTARDYEIAIPGDKATGRTRRIDPIRVARETVMALDGLASTVDLVTDLSELDPREAEQWTASLDQSIRALNRLNKKIKEAVL